MNIINETLKPDGYYHIYNRGINSCEIFFKVENYLFFLRQFSKYMNDYVDVYAYCLMPNHFHFLIKVNSETDLLKTVEINKTNDKLKEGLHAVESIISKQFARFFSSYTQAFNKVNNRHGALFESPFKRKKVKNDDYLINLILYVHHNPIDLNVDFDSYKYSSYRAIISNLKTNIQKEEVIKLYFDVENFIYVHRSPSNFNFNFL